MKRNNLFKMSLGTVAIMIAMSAHAKTSSADFNSMIEENNATQKQLTNSLAKQLKTDKIKKKENPDFIQVGEEVLGKGGSENVVATTTPPNSKQVMQKKTATKNAFDKTNFNRLSEELKDIKD